MPHFTTERQLPYTPEQMFALVADVERYPEFLPLCESLVVTARREVDGKAQIVADMTVGYKAIRETFTSQVLLDPDSGKIVVTYVDGPFRQLENVWTFRPAAGGCIVHFDIRYEFKSPMLALLVGAMFDRAFRKFSDAFVTRANAVYGDTRADDWLSGSLRPAPPRAAS